MPNENRNWIAFILVAGVIFLTYQFFIVGPQAKIAAERGQGRRPPPPP